MEGVSVEKYAVGVSPAAKQVDAQGQGQGCDERGRGGHHIARGARAIACFQKCRANVVAREEGVAKI